MREHVYDKTEDGTIGQMEFWEGMSRMDEEKELAL